MAKSGISHVVTTVPVAKSEFESEEFHALNHGNSFPASPDNYQLFFRDDLSKWYIYYSASWIELTYGSTEVDAKIATHAALTITHGATDAIADQADIATHAALTITHGATDAIADQADIATHAALLTGIHGLALGARVYHNADQTVPTSTHTVLAFNSERYDTGGIHDTVTNNSRLTCKTAGKYLIITNIQVLQYATGRFRVGILLNGASLIGARELGFYNAEVMELNESTIYSLAVNDYVEVVIWQTTGGNITIKYEGLHTPEFMMQRIG